MGRATRFVCVFVPFFLTAASLTFQIMVGLGGTNAKNNYLSNIYFLQANTTTLANNASFASIPTNSATDPADKDADGNIIIKNYYDIGLWGYCAGSGPNTSATVLSLGQTSNQAVDFCTAKQLHFSFDPRVVWGINSSFVANSTTKYIGTELNVFGNDLNNDLNSALDSYTSVASKWISTLYIIAVVATGVELLVGIFGLFSRLGSVFTSIASFISSCFLWAFTILATVTYVGLAKVLTAGLTQYGVTFYIGRTMFIYMWLAVACSLVSGLFWAFSACCCSGHSRRPEYYEKGAPYTYENIDGPHQQQHAPPLNYVGGRPTAYEPYRHGQ
jgi:hypothetical protein